MAFKMSWGIFHDLLGYYPLLPLIFVFVLFPTPVPHHGTRLSAKRRSHWDTRLFSVSVVFMPVPRKTVIQGLLSSLFFCRLIAGGCDGFLSCFSGFFIWSRRGYRQFGQRGQENTHRERYASLPHTDLVRSRTKAEHSCFIQTEIKQSSSYLAVSTHTLGPVHLRRGREGVASSTWHVQHLVWLSITFSFFFLVACWSTLKATLFILSFHLLLGPGYRVSPASDTKRCFSQYLIPTLYFLPVLGKRLLVKTVSWLILSYAALWLRLGHHRNTDAHWETDLQNQQTSWGKDSAQRTRCLAAAVLVLLQLCNKFDERGNPYHGWIFTHNVHQSNLLRGTHGWIFTHNVRHESLTMIKSWVNFHPQSTPCKCCYC